MPAQRAEYKAMIEKLPETDKARLAAYIDSEGTIYINVAEKLRGRMKNAQYRLSVSITNTDHRLMNWLKQHVDGSVYYVKYEKCKHLGKKQVMRWQVNNMMAEAILEICLPYMLMKKPQAEVGLSFSALKKAHQIIERDSRGRVVSAPLTEEEMAARHALKLQIEQLNKSNGLELVS